MTDKQIIIDGVDVSGCVYFCNGYCNENDVAYKCNLNNENCYYKQLKRKEQECDRLKELVKKQKDVLIHKTILADEYEKAYSFENLKVAKLKGCLTEIKEIACRLPIGVTREQILQKISEVENG